MTESRDAQAGRNARGEKVERGLIASTILLLVVRREAISLGIGTALFRVSHDPGSFLLLLLLIDVAVFSTFQLLAQHKDGLNLSDWLLPIATAVPLIGFLVYATTVGGYAAYFNHFQVGLDEVGLGEGRIIGDAGYHLLLLLGLIAVVALLSLAIEGLLAKIIPFLRRFFRWVGMIPIRFFRWIDRKIPFLHRFFRWVGRNANGFFRWAGRNANRFFQWIERIPFLDRFFRWVGRNANRFFRWIRREVSKVLDWSPSSKVLAWFVAASVLGFFVLLHVDVISEAQTSAECAEKGFQIKSPLIGIATEPVKLEGRGKAHRLDKDKLLLLGSGKMDVFFDTTLDKTIRVLPTQIALIRSPKSPPPTPSNDEVAMGC